MTGLNTRFKELYDAAASPLTSIGGTANAVTATLDPALDGDGLVVGMGFTLTWGAENTAGVTLAINGGTPAAVLNADGSALSAGGWSLLVSVTGMILSQILKHDMLTACRDPRRPLIVTLPSN